MSEVYRGKWITIAHVANPQRKTRVFHIWTKEGDEKDLLGHIDWDTRWRKYVFRPARQTIWEQDCLRDVITFLDQLKAERQAGVA